jgi:hypothetical protein
LYISNTCFLINTALRERVCTAARGKLEYAEIEEGTKKKNHKITPRLEPVPQNHSNTIHTNCTNCTNTPI